MNFFIGDSNEDRPWQHRRHFDVRRGGDLLPQVRDIISSSREPRELFYEFTRALESRFPIRRGILALREQNQTRFLAAASWKSGEVRRNLSLRMPNSASLFDKVAEDGRTYRENYAAFFDGNPIERRLLMDEDTLSFVLKPIKYEGRVVALLGYSSENADAFAAMEESVLDPVMASFGEKIGQCLEQQGPTSPAR